MERCRRIGPLGAKAKRCMVFALVLKTGVFLFMTSRLRS